MISSALFDALSFSNWRDGPNGLFNCWCTIAWHSLGITNHQQAANLLGRFLDGARKWSRIGGPDHRPDRRRWRSQVGPRFEFRYAYTHENSGERGFHSHDLMIVPDVRYPAFTVWARQILPRLAHHPGTQQTLDIDRSRHRVERDRVQWQWRVFRYIAKGCDPDVLHRRVGFPLEPAVVLRDLLQLGPYPSALPVRCRVLSGVSRDLRPAQLRMGYQSWLFASRRDLLYVGEDLETYRDREREEHFRRVILPTLTTCGVPFPVTDYSLPPRLRSCSDV